MHSRKTHKLRLLLLLLSPTHDLRTRNVTRKIYATRFRTPSSSSLYYDHHFAVPGPLVVSTPVIRIFPPILPILRFHEPTCSAAQPNVTLHVSSPQGMQFWISRASSRGRHPSRSSRRGPHQTLKNPYYRGDSTEPSVCALPASAAI